MNSLGLSTNGDFQIHAVALSIVEAQTHMHEKSSTHCILLVKFSHAELNLRAFKPKISEQDTKVTKHVQTP